MHASDGKSIAVVATLHVAHYFIFLSPMDAEAEWMHEQQIDPTDMVLIPYDTTRLSVYVSGTLIFLLISGALRLQVIQQIPPLTLLLYATAVVGGAPLTQHAWHSLLACLYVAALVLALNNTHPPSWVESVRRCSSSQGCLFGAAVAHILRLYDRGWQVQRWPVPAILGSTVGWTIGLAVGVLWTTAVTMRKERQR